MHHLKSLVFLLLTLLLAAYSLHAQPRLGYFPESFDADSDDFPAIFWTAFNIGNSGDSVLTWRLQIVNITDPDDHQNAWIFPETMEGETLPGETSIVPVLINTGAMLEGMYVNEIQIFSNDPSREYFNFDASVTFTEIGSKSMQLVPEEVKFEGHNGTLELGADYFAMVLVANPGENPIHLDSAVVTPDIFGFNFEPTDVQPGEYVAFDMSFMTEELGEYVGTLTVYSADAGFDGAQYIPISARVFENAVPLDAPVHPPTFVLLSAYPNPFNSSTTISYFLPSPGRYAIDVIDIQGRLVTKLSDGWKEAGSYREVLEANRLTNGQYILKLVAANQAESIPIVIIK